MYEADKANLDGTMAISSEVEAGTAPATVTRLPEQRTTAATIGGLCKTYTDE